jgi:hypothetical protein
VSAGPLGAPAFTVVFDLAAEGEVREVLVRPEPPRQAAAPAKPAPPGDTTNWSAMSNAGLGLGMGGIVTAAVGFFVLVGADPLTQTKGDVGGSLLGVGTALALTGWFLDLASRRHGIAGLPPPRLAVSPVVERRASGLSLQGTF